MIRVTIQRSGDAIRAFRVKGHADYAEEGSDIFCAAVSMLCINTVNCIEELCRDRTEAREEAGFLEAEFPEGLSEGGTLLVKTMIKGLCDLADGEGKPYLKVEFEED